MRLNVLGRFRADDAACACTFEFVEPAGTRRDRADLVVDADDCDGGGRLADAPACRATVVDALTERDADRVRTRASGCERTYDGDAAALFLAAGRFVDRAAFHDEALADRARCDPLRAAADARGRAGPVATVAAETGLAEGASRLAGYESLDPTVGPTFARSRVTARPPPEATLADRWTVETDATIRLYETPTGRRYHLVPVEAGFEAATTAALAEAYERLASGAVGGGERAAGRAVRRVADASMPVETMTAVLEKHTRGHGVFDDLFADGRVSDAFATAPVEENPVRVVVDGERTPTNVELSGEGAGALASRFRRESGRAFSRASPTLDAVVDPADGDRVRVAGVTDPVSDGLGFAFRAHGREAWTLPALVANGTLPADAAALLSVAVERAAAGLVAGPRGAGKTTLLGALLGELPATTRAVVLEDTPELPVASLRERGRDVQALRVERDADDGPSLAPTAALRTALRLGGGALVVGEVRGEEAAALYEAMRVGASDGAVLGTIHGDGAATVRERVVTDLGVPESSFASTDLVVTLNAEGDRRVAAVEEVESTAGGTTFAPLYETRDGELAAAGRIDRGNSDLVASLARAGESYAAVREALDRRRRLLSTLAATDRVRPIEVETAYRERGSSP